MFKVSRNLNCEVISGVTLTGPFVISVKITAKGSRGEPFNPSVTDNVNPLRAALRHLALARCACIPGDLAKGGPLRASRWIPPGGVRLNFSFQNIAINNNHISADLLSRRQPL